MVQKITVSDSTAEQLTELQGDGETRADVIRRFLPEETDESTEESDQLAESVMTLDDVEAAHQEQLSPSGYLNDRYGVDVSAAADESDLRQRLEGERGADSSGVN